MSDDTTQVIEYARHELLQVLARTEDILNVDRAQDAAAGRPCHIPEHYPLQSVEWAADLEDIVVAVKECVALGHVEVRGYPLSRSRVKITPAGYAWVRERYPAETPSTPMTRERWLKRLK